MTRVMQHLLYDRTNAEPTLKTMEVPNKTTFIFICIYKEMNLRADMITPSVIKR